MLRAFRTLLKLIAGIWVVLLAIAVPDWGFLQSEITEYSAQCEVPVVDGRCDKHAFTVRPTTYKVLGDQQAVVYWTEGFPPERLTDCAVRDRENWSCTYSDGSATIGFDGGRYFSRSLGTRSDFSAEFDAKRYALSRWDYLRLSWSGK